MLNTILWVLILQVNMCRSCAGDICVNNFTAMKCSLVHCSSVDLFLQLAWSHSGDQFVVVTNGIGSSIIMFAVNSTGNFSEKPNLTILWTATAGKTSQSQTSHGLHVADVSEEEDDKIDAFYMAEINPSGICLAVKESRGHTYLHLYSSDGLLNKVSVLEYFPKWGCALHDSSNV